VLVCTLGDLTLDVSVRLHGPLAPGGDTSAHIRLGAGGQAANVAAWAAALGGDARFIGKRGADGAAELVSAELEAKGVDVVGPAAGRNGVVCILISPTGERSMAPDPGAAADLRPDEVEPRWLEGCDHLFISGYALFRASRDAAIRAVDLVREHGATVSVDLSSWSALQEAGAETIRSLLAGFQPEVVFANEAEEHAFGGPLPETTWILKRGARGCSFDGVERTPVPVDSVVDTTGAGDALAAGWIVGGPDLALEAAARCVSRQGAMP
jgi:ribokinase